MLGPVAVLAVVLAVVLELVLALVLVLVLVLVQVRLGPVLELPPVLVLLPRPCCCCWNRLGHQTGAV